MTPNLVSFIVPTLNRGPYVERAVRSCLSVDLPANISIEVVVIDSHSIDGSWERLNAAFGRDCRVRLIQNERGSGPMPSWIQGALASHGEFLTYVWSDDFISADFLRVLLPHLQDGVEIVVGRAIVRNVDNTDSFPSAHSVVQASGKELLLSYFTATKLSRFAVASPVCSLFRRTAIERWIALVKPFCNETLLKRDLMWRRAIGPDLMLYLLTITNSNFVPLVDHVVAQFSSHHDSITVQSSATILKLGYWSARNVLIMAPYESVQNRPISRTEAASQLCKGVALACSLKGPLRIYRKDLYCEILALWRKTGKLYGRPQMMLATVIFPIRHYFARLALRSGRLT